MSEARDGAGVLFAGGRSSRMGSDKAMLTYQGATFWEIQTELLRSFGFTERIVVSPRKPFWLPQDFAWVKDDDGHADAGPLAGFAGLLAGTEATSFHVHGIDFPLLTEASFQQFSDLEEPGRGWVPQIGGWVQPFVAHYPREALAVAKFRLEQGDGKVRGWVMSCVGLGLIDVIAVPKACECHFQNVNTPEDLDGIKSRCSSKTTT